ncbi:MAG TPA: HlyD family secretion protein, partial [bacterium]|nr:HlyD family secretion protein [bacterium]
VDAISGKKFEGVVDSIGSSTGSTFTLLPPDNSTGNFTKVVQRVPVKIDLPNLTPEDIDLLAAGLSVEVAVKLH